MDTTVNYDGKQVTFCNVVPEDYIEGLLIAGHWYELPNLEFIRSLQVKGNYVDVGAYIGTHSLFFSLFCPSARVYSFEPQPDVYRKLVHNLEVNNIIHCHTFELGLSDTSRRGTIKGNNTNKGGAWLLPGDDVDVVTLDSISLSEVKLMKIDVEGMELSVLRGAITTLQSVDHLFIEMWSESTCKRNNTPYTVDEVTNFLVPLGFRLQNKQLKEDLFYFCRST